MIENLSPNRMMAYFLMSSYLYYEKDKSVLTDFQFDNLCEKLIEKWNEITHPHKKLVNIDDLKAGTGYRIKYTNMIMDAAELWYKENK
tara:strand:- start:10282 stop:10545 length:264 start_codon:yes stop_codon:yes gene_type:complete